MALKFEDIDEWTPSSISIVDQPAHPLCLFEVYDDDEEYVTKSIEITNEEGEIMVEEIPTEPKVEVSEGFLERFLDRFVSKSEEIPEAPAEKKEEPAKDEIIARIEKLEAKVKELEADKKPEEKEKKEEAEVPEAVAKSDSEGEAAEETEVPSEPEVVAKSKEVDPDTIITTETTKTLAERCGRNSNGMTW